MLPPSFSLARAICVSPHHWFCFPDLVLLILRHGQPRAGNDARMSAEFSDDGITHGDPHVVDAGPAAARDLARSGDKSVAELARLDEGDLALSCHHALIVRVAGKGEGGIGEREDE